MATVDPEFAREIPPLRDEEKRQLEESLLEEGCRDPIIIWQGTILDGHNRHEICTRLGIGYQVRAAPTSVETREDALDYMRRLQLGRRNLTPADFEQLLGRRYNATKKDAHRPEGTKKGAQNEPLKTAERLGKEHGVSPATVKRAGALMDIYDKVVATEPEIVAKGRDEILKRAKEIQAEKRESKRAETIAKLTDIKALAAKELEGVFDVLVIDPPWQMKKIERDVRPNQTEFDYPTMTEEELAGMSLPMADDCHVWLWTTHKHLPMALRLLDTWGLKYVCTFVWHKSGGFQPIGLPQYNCEFVLYARKGSPKFIDTKAFNTCFDAPRGDHSEKPGEFYDVVRRVTAGRRADMFNRRKIEGFDGWGKEAAR